MRFNRSSLLSFSYSIILSFSTFRVVYSDFVLICFTMVQTKMSQQQLNKLTLNICTDIYGHQMRNPTDVGHQNKLYLKCLCYIKIQSLTK